MKTTTIINDGKLIGIIKLQPEFLMLPNNTGLLLTQETNSGDTQLLTFRFTVVPVNKIK